MPQLKPMIEQLVKEKKESVALSQELENHRILGSAVETAKDEKLLDKKIEEINRRIEELENLGVVIKDLDSGLVDFPADRFGEKVMLCWKLGEAEVSYWHTMYEGFAGRRPLRVGP